MTSITFTNNDFDKAYSYNLVKHIMEPNVRIRITKNNDESLNNARVILSDDMNRLEQVISLYDNDFEGNNYHIIEINNNVFKQLISTRQLDDWNGYSFSINAKIITANDEEYEDTALIYMIEPSLSQSLQYLYDNLYEILENKGISLTGDEGFLSLVHKVKQLPKTYIPKLDGTDNTTTISTGRTFTTNNGWAGGYNQVGYLSDGFTNWENWVLTMTLQTSKYDGGFIMLFNPYTAEGLSSCTEQNKWDCIYKNGRGDVLQWLDGQIKANVGPNLYDLGISYTKDTTMSVKIVKKGGRMEYHENDVLKGEFSMLVSNSPNVYIGVFTWGGSGSMNRFSNVRVEKI